MSNEYQQFFQEYDQLKFMSDLKYVLKNIREYDQHFSCGLKYFGDLDFLVPNDVVVRIHISGYKTIYPTMDKDNLNGVFETEFWIQDQSFEWLCLNKFRFEYFKNNKNQYLEMIPDFLKSLKSKMDKIKNVFKTMALFGYGSPFKKLDDGSKILLFNKILFNDQYRIHVFGDLIAFSQSRNEIPQITNKYTMRLIQKEEEDTYLGKPLYGIISKMGFSNDIPFEQSVAKFEKLFVIPKLGMDYFTLCSSELKDMLIKGDF